MIAFRVEAQHQLLPRGIAIDPLHQPEPLRCAVLINRARLLRPGLDQDVNQAPVLGLPGGRQRPVQVRWVDATPADDRARHIDAAARDQSPQRFSLCSGSLLHQGLEDLRRGLHGLHVIARQAGKPEQGASCRSVLRVRVGAVVEQELDQRSVFQLRGHIDRRRPDVRSNGQRGSRIHPLFQQGGHGRDVSVRHSVEHSLAERLGARLRAEQPHPQPAQADQPPGFRSSLHLSPSCRSHAALADQSGDFIGAKADTRAEGHGFPCNV